MKKLLFLLFGALFALAGCADESGTNGGNTETCPITSADFTYERVIKCSSGLFNFADVYNIKLLDDNKSQYADNILWKANNDKNSYRDAENGIYNNREYNKIEPQIPFSYPEYSPNIDNKTATLFYNGYQCGEPIQLKINSTSSMCDKVIIDNNVSVYNPYNNMHLQMDGRKAILQEDGKILFEVYINDDNYTNAKLIFPNNIGQLEEDLNKHSSYMEYQQLYFYIPYDNISTIIKNGYNNDMYLDVMVDYSDGQCIVPLKYNVVFVSYFP